jgi:hypothetical protein
VVATAAASACGQQQQRLVLLAALLLVGAVCPKEGSRPSAALRGCSGSRPNACRASSSRCTPLCHQQQLLVGVLCSAARSLTAAAAVQVV